MSRADDVGAPGRRMTARGAATLVTGILLAIAANVFAVPVLLFAAVLLFAMLVGSAIVVFAATRSATVGRSVAADLLTVGEDTTVRVRLELRTNLGAPVGRWHDVLPRAVHGDPAGRFPPDTVESVPGGVAMSMTYPIEGARRGLAALGPLRLVTSDPFGLYRRIDELGDPTPITIVPPVLPLPRLADRTGRAGGTAQTSSHRLGQGADNLAPRRYVPGDSMRRIHWRATAHRGDLMVRQEEQESSPDALVVLDRAGTRWPSRAASSGASGSARDGGSPAAPDEDGGFDRAVTACASVALHLVDQGFAVDVVDATGVLLGRLRGAEDEREGLLVTLAGISPRLGERDAGLPAAGEGHTVGPLVMITGMLDAGDAAALPHGGAGTPILLATATSPASLAAAAERGWRTAALGDDPAESWATAAPEEPGSAATSAGSEGAGYADR
ncbi:DUF58 domain-containing protein [uncultured Microbacterium sp.]|uniref:DUF58 domain-containing protein n=1 Tax=uncultured Microbacterium sp. TaxID=191216 RepID=UPI0025F8C7A4|nr:DUF58 domain-containing protein [uncultured Microbacterium sp.]